MRQVEDFYKATITQDWSIGTGIFYVSVKPTITEGWLYVSPNNPALREQIYYNGVGTDGNGDYITVTQRGIGTTDEQTHTIGEPIRMNVGEGYVKYLTDAIDDIVAGAAPNADTSTKGLVEIATDAQIITGTDTGETGALLVATPSQLKSNYEKIVPIIRKYLNAESPATWTKPAGLKYIEVEVQAGGGGAGGVSSDGNATGGGGAGGYSKKIIAATSLGDTETVTIGAGGAGSVNNGAAGGNSSFGTHLSATGGAGTNTKGKLGGAGGAGSDGDINIDGGDGGSAAFDSTYGGTTGNNGGASFFGGGGRGTLSATASNGRAFGSGGGGITASNDNDYAGGTGASGIVIVKEFY